MFYKLKITKINLLLYSLIACAIIVRFVLIAYGWPDTNGEEGTMGLAGMHIAFNGEWPIYYYGQHYMGTIEAYLGALFFQFLEPSVFALRLGMLLLFALFLIALYKLGNFLYAKRVTLVTLIVLLIGGPVVMTPQLMAVGGAVETLLFGTVALLSSAWLCFSRLQDGATWKRRGVYFLLGLVTGLGIWSHSLVYPFIFFSFVLLAIFCIKDILSRNIFLLIAGITIGLIPLIIYNFTSPIEYNSFVVLWNLHHSYYPDAPTGWLLWLKQLTGTFLYSLPLATGMWQVGDLKVLPIYGPVNKRSILPIVLQGGWAIGYMLMLILSTYASGSKIVRLRKVVPQTERERVERYQAVVKAVAQLALLLSGWATILLFLMSATSAQRPWSTRYLVGLLIVTPAVLAPLVNWGFVFKRSNKAVVSEVENKAIQSDAFIRRGQQTFAHVGKIGTRTVLCSLLLLVISVTPLIGFVKDIQTAPEQSQETRYKGLIQELDRQNIKHVYSGYWVCDRLIFSSQEKIICDQRDPFMNSTPPRYYPYHQMVKNDKGAAFVFTTESTDFRMREGLRQFSDPQKYQKIVVEGFEIYKPVNN